MTETEIMALLKSINIKVEALMAQMTMFQEAFKPVPQIEVQESILMDLTNVTIMAQTDKAILAVKKGYQKWVPLSCIDVVQREAGFELGPQYDLILANNGKWIDKKSWDKFNPQKGGGK